MDISELEKTIVKAKEVGSAVKSVKTEIEKGRDHFVNSEPQTRTSLIDPILSSLGWDVAKVEMVRSEYSTERGGKADYALLHGNVPVALIEAKRLGQTWGSEVAEQLGDYINSVPGVRFAIFTNGDHWRMRENGKTVLDIHITKQASLDSAIELLRLWRDVMVQADAGKGRRTKPVKGDDRLPPDGWTSIEDTGFNPTGKALTAIWIDGQQFSVTTWRQLAVEVANWLVDNGHLRKRDCPIEAGNRSKWYLISSTPIHKSGNRFNSEAAFNAGLVMETTFSSKIHLRNTRMLLDRFGVSLDRVRFQCK